MKFILKICLTVACFSFFGEALRAQSCLKGENLSRHAVELFQRSQWLLSYNQFSVLANEGCSESIRILGLKGQALSLAELSETDEAARAFDLLERVGGEKVKSDARFLKSFYGLSGTHAALTSEQKTRLQAWNQRAEKNWSIDSLDAPAAAVSEIKKKLDLKPSRSPWAAGIASAILPGAGQAYSGAWSSAGVALVFNALFLATTLEFSQKNMPSAAIASGMVFSVVYVGNIINATQSADRFNQAQRREEMNDLKQVLFPELKF